MTIKQFIKKHEIRMVYVATDSEPPFADAGWDADHYICEFRKPGFDRENRTPETCFRTRYSKGSGHHGKPPTKSEVLHCLASDASCVMDNQSFHDFCGDLGYNEDSIKGFKIYLACKKIVLKLEKFLGREALEELVYKIERE